MPVILKNNAFSALATAITTSDTGIVVANGSQFPTITSGDYFYVTLVSQVGQTEIVKVTARVGNSMTVVRAQDGSSAASFQVGTLVDMRVNVASIADLRDEATEITIADTGGYYTSGTVEGALQEVSGVKNPKNVAILFADTVLTYTSGLAGTVTTGDVIRTRTEGFSYTVAASAATDQHVTTAGGVKLYVQAGASGYNVKAFGAVGNGVVNDTAAFASAALCAGPSNPIYVPSGLYSKSTIANENNYFWVCENALDPSGANPVSLLGHVEQSFANRRLISKTANAAGEFAEVQMNKAFSYSGGTPGNVCSNLQLSTSVSAGVTNFVWGITSVLNNSANAGENVAIYGQGNRVAGIGAVWGGVFEARDKTNTSGVGKGGTVGIEIDIFANGLVDPSFNRIGLDVVVGKGDASGLACQAGYGVRVTPQASDASNGSFLIGYQALGATSADFAAGSTSIDAFVATGAHTSGFRIMGSCAIGLNTSTGTISSNAVRLASGQNIAMEGTGVIRTSYGVTAEIWGFYNGATERFGINTTSGDLRVNGTQVVTSRRTGWTVPTGTATRAAFATSTVTTAELAERVKALIDDLTTHGLIGA